MTIKELSEAIFKEAFDYANGPHHESDAEIGAYIKGTRSPAMLEFVVKRAVELASDSCISYLEKEGLKVSVSANAGEILAQIEKELEELK